MKLYDNNPQSKAMQRLIHDTRNAGDTLRYNLKKLRERLREIGAVDAAAFVHMEYVESRGKEIEKSIDTYYERFSNDFPEVEGIPFEPKDINPYTLTLSYFKADKWSNEMLPVYNYFKWVVGKYTLIRKPYALTSFTNVAGERKD